MDDEQTFDGAFVEVASQLVAADEIPDSTTLRIFFDLARILDDSDTESADVPIALAVFDEMASALHAAYSKQAPPPSGEATHDQETLSPEDRAAFLKAGGFKSEDWRDEEILLAMAIGLY